MKYLSVCSGIEAATCAWHPLGWTPVGFSEIEKFPSAVLAHHYPHVPNLGDMTKFQEWPDDLAPDILVGGTPCQSFSVAGLRKGLADPRGNLALVYLAMADKYRPEWLVWENVPGVLSSDGGRDFGAFLGGLGELGYGFAYRVLDAQFFGVAQRRRRVFVVANAGDWRRAAAVLFEREGLSGHPAPQREAREGFAASIGSCATDGGWPHDVAGTLDAHYGEKMGLEDQHIHNQRASRFVPAYAVRTANTSANGHGIASDVTHTLDRAQGQAIAFGWQNSSSQGDSASEHVTPTLDKSKTPAVAVALRGREGGATAEMGDEVGHTLRASQGGGDKPHVLTGMAVRRLTPIECERLQGFPDSYTDIQAKGKPTPDGPRYKALGNSMAVPVMSWIGRRIAAVAAQTEGAA